jgi:hypothetical protein
MDKWANGEKIEDTAVRQLAEAERAHARESKESLRRLDSRRRALSARKAAALMLLPLGACALAFAGVEVSRIFESDPAAALGVALACAWTAAAALLLWQDSAWASYDKSKALGEGAKIAREDAQAQSRRKADALREAREIAESLPPASIEGGPKPRRGRL